MDRVEFRFRSLPGVTFAAARSTETENDPDGSRRSAGWIQITATDDVTGDVVADSGSAGPETASAPAISWADAIATYFCWELSFSFETLPAVTFYAC
jgi:hypothetical protein